MKYIHDNFKNVEIDLRHDSELLTSEFGIYVLYIRNCKYVRCRCFNDLNKTGEADCPYCLGTGYLASVQKIKAIESSNSAYADTSSIGKRPIGVTDMKNEVYYIRYQYNPKERDIILKVTWDKNGRPVDILKVLEITNVYEMRGDNGRVELNGCVINNRTDLVVPYRKYLSVIPKKLLYQISNGDKSVWPLRP